MLTIYSPVQRTLQPAYVIKQGEHATSFDVPERIDSILTAINNQGLGPVVAPDDAGLDPIHAVHDAGMIDFLMTAYDRQLTEAETSMPVFPSFFPPPGQRRLSSSFEGQKGYYCANLIPITRHTWDAALASAQTAIAGARMLRSGEPQVYALCRPSGHHAGPDFFGGYCYLNNTAIAAQLLHDNGCRVAILDIDYHHGNGTQAIFYENSDVWFGSLHVDPDTDYPFFSGYADERGKGVGEDTNWNVPLSRGTEPGEYLSSLEITLERLADFNPQWLVVAAGFDTYIDDPIGTFRLTTPDFTTIGQMIRGLHLPTLVIQEGGYYVPGLGENVVAFIRGVVGG